MRVRIVEGAAELCTMPKRLRPSSTSSGAGAAEGPCRDQCYKCSRDTSKMNPAKVLICEMDCGREVCAVHAPNFPSAMLNGDNTVKETTHKWYCEVCLAVRHQRPLFVEICSGSGMMSSWMMQFGFYAVSIDTLEEGRFTRDLKLEDPVLYQGRHIQDDFKSWMLHQQDLSLPAFVWIAPPCVTFSRQSSQTSHFRHFGNIGGASIAALEAFQLQLAIYAYLDMAVAKDTKFVIENPMPQNQMSQGSNVCFFDQKQIKDKLLQVDGFQIVEVCFCKFGELYKKPTLLGTNSLELIVALGGEVETCETGVGLRRSRSSKYWCCATSPCLQCALNNGKKHPSPLKGGSNAKRAAQVPLGLATLVAATFANAHATKVTCARKDTEVGAEGCGVLLGEEPMVSHVAPATVTPVGQAITAGQRVIKHFGPHGWYYGTITMVDEFVHVKYDDGEEEDYTLEQVDKILVATVGLLQPATLLAEENDMIIIRSRQSGAISCGRVITTFPDVTEINFHYWVDDADNSPHLPLNQRRVKPGYSFKLKTSNVLRYYGTHQPRRHLDIPYVALLNLEDYDVLANRFTPKADHSIPAEAVAQASAKAKKLAAPSLARMEEVVAASAPTASTGSQLSAGASSRIGDLGAGVATGADPYLDSDADSQAGFFTCPSSG